MDIQFDEIQVSVIIIPYNNSAKFQTRLERDIVPTIMAHSMWKFQVIIIDNSDRSNEISLDILHDKNISALYLWPACNLMYGPAMNLALSINQYPYSVYVCSNHGHMYDPTWIDDLLLPIINSGNVAMTGSYHPSCHPSTLGFPSHLPRFHIQGGIFGARTALMQAHPYTKDGRYVHAGSDVYQSFQLLNAGLELYDVNTIKSVWRQKINQPQKWKYVHDYSE